MKISKRTLTLLKNFSGINSSIIINPGNTIKTVSPQKTIVGISQTAEDFPCQIAIYDLNRFLSVLSTFNDPDIDFKKDKLTISENNRKLNYIYADPKVIVTLEKDIKEPDQITSFSLSAADLSNLIKVSYILKFSDVLFEADGEKLFLKGCNPSETNNTADVYSIELGETELTFKVFIKIEKLKLLEEDFEVSVFKGLVKFSSDSQLTYYVAIEKNSEV